MGITEIPVKAPRRDGEGSPSPGPLTEVRADPGVAVRSPSVTGGTKLRIGLAGRDAQGGTTVRSRGVWMSMMRVSRNSTQSSVCYVKTVRRRPDKYMPDRCFILSRGYQTPSRSVAGCGLRVSSSRMRGAAGYQTPNRSVADWPATPGVTKVPIHIVKTPKRNGGRRPLAQEPLTEVRAGRRSAVSERSRGVPNSESALARSGYSPIPREQRHSPSGVSGCR
jgi:hypothetical protein